MKIRVISFLLSMVLLMSLLPLSVFADEGGHAFRLDADKEQVKPGEQFTVTVSLAETVSAEEDITNVQLALYYDGDVLSYVSHQLSDACKDVYMSGHIAARKRVQLSRTSMVAEAFEIPAGEVISVTFTAKEEIAATAVAVLHLESKLSTSTMQTTVSNIYKDIVVDGAASAVMGDVNEDGKLDSADVNCIYRAVMGYAELSEAQMKMADVNDDGTVNSADVNVLYRMVMGYIQNPAA